MEEPIDILKLAKGYQNNKQWHKAISQYNIYINKTDLVEDVIYVNYAKCLKFSGDTRQAKELLNYGLKEHPESEKLLVELFHLSDSMEEWEVAKKAAESLTNLNPKEARYYFLLGRAYSVLRNDAKARESYKTGLEFKHNLNIEAIFKKIRASFTKETEQVETEYITIDGFNNYGGLIHKIAEKKYFTKISLASKGAKREETFYRELCEKFPVLKEFTPEYIDSQIIDNIMYLTLEMIEEETIETKNIREIITITNKIATINYEDLISEFPNPNYAFQLRNKPTAIAIFFTKIHKEQYNERLFNLLYKLIGQKGYPKITSEIIKQLESLVMDNKLYCFISPEKHYSLVHRDFTTRNVKFNKIDASIKVFDWAGFSIAPHFITIARYFSSSLTDYETVRSFYLEDNDINGGLSLIEKIFFLYSLILLYILRLKEKKVEKNLNKYITPAICDFKKLVEKFMEYEFKDGIVQVLNEKEEIEYKNIQRIKELKLKNKQEELTNKKLKKKLSKLENEKANMINSKSWKLTKPLRKIMEKF